MIQRTPDNNSAAAATVAPGEAAATGAAPDATAASGATGRRGWLGFAVMVAGLVVLAGTARLAYPVEGAHFDEYYHMLSARGVLAGEGLRIGETWYYDRAAVFTYSVAASMAVFGDTHWAARLPSVLCGVGLVVLLGVWARREAGPGAGWACGVIAAVLPTMVNMSTFSRFYMMHVLLVGVAAWAVYGLTDGHRRLGRLRGLGLGVVGLVSLFFAYQLQQTTVAVGAILAGWVMGTLLRRGLLLSEGAERRRYLWLVAGAAVAAGVLALVAWQTGVLGEKWASYRRAALWSEATADDYRFYHRWLLERYGLFYLGLPVLLIAGLAKQFRLVAFALWVFVCGVLVQSLGGMKAERYLSYAMPFLILIWGVGLSALLPQLAVAAEWGVRRVTGGRAVSRPVGVFATAGLAVVVLAPLLNNTFAIRILPRMYDRDELTRHPYVKPQWVNVLDELRTAKAETSALGGEPVLVTPSGVKALYHLGRLDYTLSRTQLEGFSEGELDPRLGRPTISTPQSLAEVMAKYPTGLVFSERVNWRTSFALTPEVADLIESRMERVPLSDPDFVLFRWGPGLTGRDAGPGQGEAPGQTEPAMATGMRGAL